MALTFNGSCLCGGITFSVNGFSDKAANCHCSMCRKFHGAAFGTLVSVTGLTWLTGVEKLKHYTALNGTNRTFCHECGTSLGFRVKGAQMDDMELAISTFNEDIPVKIDAHIYTKYKANWCELETDLPTFSEGRENSGYKA
jgi:hypothetical protein